MISCSFETAFHRFLSFGRESGVGGRRAGYRRSDTGIAQELRCVVCQIFSVADSPSEMAQQMRGVVREQLQAGKTPQEVKDFFCLQYGEWVLLP